MRTFLKSLIIIFLAILSLAPYAYANDKIMEEIDPQLTHVVETIKSRILDQETPGTKLAPKYDFSDPFFELSDELTEAPFDRNPENIREITERFRAQSEYNPNIDVNLISKMFEDYANEIEKTSNSNKIKNIALDYINSDHWFEQFMAYRLSAFNYTHNSEYHQALNHAQKALSVIPISETELTLFAKIESSILISYFHNLMGNRKLAIESSQEYLEYSEHYFDTKIAVDLINNLMYSSRLWRDTPAQEYLAKVLLELEGDVESAAPGLSELRIAQSRNDTGDFEASLKFSRLAHAKSTVDPITFQSKVAEAIALIGLGRIEDADKIVGDFNINLSENSLLTDIDNPDILYLGYLRARKTGNENLATSLYNRRIDVLSRKNLSASTRDTTSMLAALENTRERQEERAEAAKREAELQAITIQKQRTLNRALMGLLAFLLVAVTALLAFMKYRGKTLKILAQKEKEAASADKLKSEFLGVMSHELRTPLNGIIGFADFLNQTHADPDVRKKTGVILDSGQDLLDVVEAMTDMGRIEAGKMDIFEDEVDIAELIAPLIEANRAKAEEKNVKFTAFIDPAIDIHMVDGMRFKQCIKTLLDNAISFTNKGRVHLHITAHGERAAGVDELQVVVADTGFGMSELVQSRLFTPFMQADTSLKRAHMGTGLSLAIAKALAELMGGSISVISRAGRGSEFTLKVPVTTPKALPEIKAVVEEAAAMDDAPLELTHAEALTDAERIDFDQIIEKQGETDIDLPAPIIDLMKPRSNNRPASLHVPPETKASQASHNRQGLRVLLVDDLSTNRNFVRDLLRDMECDCLDAEDGYQAIEVLRSSPVDVVLMDVHMNRMDGIEATRRIRSLDTDFANVPIIMLTADNSVEISSKSLAAGANVFLTKPVLLEELVSAFDYVFKTPKALQL